MASKENSTARLRGRLTCRSLIDFFSNQIGSAAVMFSIAIPGAVAVLGVVVDFAVLTQKKTELQSIVDQAAIAAAREFSLSNSGTESVVEAARSYVTMAVDDPSVKIEVNTEIDNTKNSVHVRVVESWTPFFAHLLADNVTPIVTEATAGLFGESKLCVLALTQSGAGAVSMTTDAHISADDCTIYSNSNHSSSVYMGDVSSIVGKLVCTVGGVKNNGGLDVDQIVTDCPVLANPLADRVPPKVGSCDFTDVKFTTGSHSLTAGTYCKGIQLSGDATVTLGEGVYIIKDGPLLVREKAKLSGKNVGFYMTGALGLMHFMNDATIELAGRQSGAMAGMLFFDDPAGSILRIHSISAKNAHTLTGTIYLPKGNLIVDPTATVGSKSAYTAIVANRLIVQNGPTLVLNSNYSQTPVPVPEGIKAAAEIHLID